MNLYTKMVLSLITCFLIGLAIGYSNPLFESRVEIVQVNSTITKEPTIYYYNYTYNYTTENMSYKVIYTDTKYQLLNIVQDNAEQYAYKKGIYDCRNFTNKDYYDLKAIGYQVDRYSTWKKTANTAHAFIGVYVYFEPTTGKIIKPDEYLEYGIPDALKEYDDADGFYEDYPRVDNDYREVCK